VPNEVPHAPLERRQAPAIARVPRASSPTNTCVTVASLGPAHSSRPRGIKATSALDPIASAIAMSRRTRGMRQMPRSTKIQRTECTPRIVLPMIDRPGSGSPKVAWRALRVSTTISQGPRNSASTRDRRTARGVGSGRENGCCPTQNWTPNVPVQGSTHAMIRVTTPVIASVTRNHTNQFFRQIRRPPPTMATAPILPGSTSRHVADGGAPRPTSGRGGTGGSSGSIGPER
jgi:hypothetical protein